MSKGRDDNHRLLHYKQSKLIHILLQTNAMIGNYSLFLHIDQGRGQTMDKNQIPIRNKWYFIK